MNSVETPLRHEGFGRMLAPKLMQEGGRKVSYKEMPVQQQNMDAESVSMVHQGPKAQMTMIHNIPQRPG